MPPSRYVCSLLLAIALAPAAASGRDAQQVVIKGKRDAATVVVKGVRDPSAWFRIESQHLIVYSDDDPDDVTELVNNLERLDYLLRLYLKPFLDPQDTSPKFTLYFQGRIKWPPEIGAHPSLAAGLLNSCVAGTEAFTYSVGKSWKLDNASLLHAEDDYTLAHNFWLYADNFLYRHTRIREPAWFMTGFVAYIAGARFTDNQMAIGRDAGTSYNLLQAIDDGQRAGALSFDDVLHGYRPSTSFTTGSAEYYKVWEFLGRSFNLVHYLLSSEDNRGKMENYLDLVNNGSESAAAFGNVFGLAGHDLNMAMFRYRHAALKIYQIDVPDLPRATVAFTRLSRIEGEFVLDNAVLKSCPAPADGKKLLARLTATAAQAPAVDFAQITLSRAQVDWGDPRDALAYLKRAATNDPYDPEPRYLLGVAYAKLAQSTEADRQDLLVQARTALTEATLLAPDASDVSYALFRVALTDPAPTEQDVGRAVDAWRHARDVPAFSRAAALAYAWLGDANNAYQAFNSLIRNKQDADNAAWASTWLARLEKGVTRNQLLAAMRSENPALPGYRSWTQQQ